MNDALTRGVEWIPDAETEPEPQGRNIIAVIGIDAYTYWPKLHNAVSDALGVQKLFVEKLGFAMPFPPLLNADATFDNIMALVTDQLPGVLQPHDNVILFYAGHGHTRVSKIGAREIESGYLVPVGAKLERWADKIRTDEFLDNVSQLPARHVLLIIDACRSGFALSGMNAYRSAVTYQETLARNVSRNVISSARRDEDALDNGPLPNHSLFTGTLIEGLNWGAADLDRNGLVSAYELGLYLQQRVGQASDSKQTPDFGSFQLDERGELVISLRNDTFDAVKARAFTAMLNHDVNALAPLVQQLAAQRPDAAETLFLQFRLRFMQNDYDGALAAVLQLLGAKFDDGAIPLSRSDLEALAVQLPYWKPVLELSAGTLPVKIDFQIENAAGEFERAPLAPATVGEAYQVSDGAIARYHIENTSAAPAHLYFLTITPHGRFIVGPLLEDDAARIDGLAPGAIGLAQKFKIKGLPSIIENRIFCAPQRVSKLLFPATVAARGLDAIAPETIATLQMQPVFYQIVSEVTTPADVLEIRNAYSHLTLDLEQEGFASRRQRGRW
jgi:hypothetical protein